jgi:microcystin-dependent protein
MVWLQIQQNVALFSLIGTRFGGDGQTTFGLPDLRSVTPNGMTYTICTSGIFPSPN